MFQTMMNGFLDNSIKIQSFKQSQILVFISF